MHGPEIDGMAPELASMLVGRIGAFRRVEAIAAGYTPDEVRARLASGRWMALRRGVFCTRENIERASLDGDRWHLLIAEGFAAAAAERLTFSHGTAARLHGLDHLRGVGTRLHITRTKHPGVTTAVDREVDVHVAGLPDEHVARGTLFDATTVSRTVADLSRYASLRDAVVVGCGALRSRKTTRDEIDGVIRTMRRWPGVRQARLVASLLDGRAETAIESLALAVWWEQKLPVPQLQARVYDADGFVGIVDGLWVDRWTAYETDGLVKYSEFGDTMLTREKLRQERLEQAGLQVRRFTWAELWNAGAASAARVRKAFRRAATLPPPRVRVYVGDRDNPPPPVDSRRTLPADWGLELVYDGLRGPSRRAKWAS